jgi:hypothetical protein
VSKVLLLVVATLGLAALILPVMRPPGGEAVLGQDLPWQIQPTSTGTIEVFGLTLGESTVADAVDKIGRRYELGLFREPDGRLSLEAYFRDAVLGGLNARIVTTADLDPAALEQLLDDAGPGERLANGTRRYPVPEAHTATALAAIITTLTYAPYVELDDALVRERFGPPAERIALEDGDHWLYPERGLDLILRQDGKSILQYLPPRDFDRLRSPLRQARENR